MNNILVQSPNDPRDYLPLTMDNGLRVLLVHHADTEKSAAALAVNVGHFDDPTDREGLAHFLEHLVFLGSQQFPEPGSYQQYISNYGGSHNAWTGTEHSCFYFDIDHDFFEGGLARFADMFSAPLFSAEAVDKERQAIEAEFSMKLKDDGRRIYQAHKESINPQHPFSKFSVGNLSTLDDRPHQSAQQAVKDFYHQQYSTSRMSLVLVSSASLEQQRQWVESFFQQLPSHLPAKTPLQPPLYLPEHLGIQLNIQPHKPTHRFVVSFALPDIQPWYPYKMVSFLAHLLGDEGPGSLLSTLKNHGWVNAMSAGGGIDGSNYKDFTLAFELMPAGMDHQQAILEHCFRYIAMLKQQPFPQHLFDERQKLVTWSFTYQESKPAVQLASDLAINIQHYPVADYVFGDYRMEQPPSALYLHLLSYFRADNLRIMLIAPEVEVDRQARWYHTPYSQVALDPLMLQNLQQMQPTTDYHLPKANPYLATELQMIDAAQMAEHPILFAQATGLQLWFKPDIEFGAPKGHIFVQLSLPNSIVSLKALALTKLWLELFLDEINEMFYPATTAGLHYNVFVHQHGLTLHCHGLSGDQTTLLTDLLTMMPKVQFQQQRFDELSRQLIQHFVHQGRSKPMNQLFSQLSALLQPLHPQPESLAAALSQTDYSEFCAFAHTLFQVVRIEALMIGNWHSSDAAKLQQHLQAWLSQDRTICAPLPRQSFTTQGIGQVWLDLAIAHDDEAMVIYFPAQQRTARDMALFMLLNHLISPEYFHELRTEQQLGYLVGTGYVPMNLKPGVAFYIQSPRVKAAELYQATLTFCQKFLEELPTLAAEEFLHLKQSLQSQIKERDNSLNSRAKRIWLAIGQGDPRCVLAAEIQQQLTEMSLADFVRFCEKLFSAEQDMIVLATSAAPLQGNFQQLALAELEQRLKLTQDD